MTPTVKHSFETLTRKKRGADLLLAAGQATRAFSIWASRPGLHRALLRPVAEHARRAVVRAGDPALGYRIGRFELDIPLSHELPRYRTLFPLYDGAIGPLARAVWEAFPESSVVDIGANVGDTAAAIRSASPAPILCVEGSDAFFALLGRNAARLGADVTLERTLVGRSRATLRGVVQAAGGTARIVEDAGAPGLAVEPLADVLARHPELPAPKLVKIDTDGFDCPIVEASTAVWERFRPVLFFEYDPEFYGAWDPQPMFAALRDLGYGHGLVYDNFGELAGALSLADLPAIDALHRRYRGANHQRYADLCLFHRDDAALASRFAGAERFRTGVRPRVPS